MEKLEALVKQLKEGSIEGGEQASAAAGKCSYKASCVATGKSFGDSCLGTGKSFGDSCMTLGPFKESCLCIGKK